MNYWRSVESASGMGKEYVWALLAVIVPTFILGALFPQTRSRLRGVLVLVVISVITTMFCGISLDRGIFETAPAYRLLHFLAQICFAVALINLIGVVIFRLCLGAMKLKPAPILHDTMLGIIYIVVALMLLGRHGVDLTGVIATSAVVTAVIGFSLQDTLGNLMGGVALQLERSVRVGDWVRIGEMEGEVREIRWRQTSIQTRNWDTVVIPNSVLMKSQVTVLGRREGQAVKHRMWVYFNVDFRHAPADVIDTVERALQDEAITDVATDPAPNCILKEFTDSYGRYAVRYWLLNLAKDDPTSSEVRTRIFVALQRARMSLSIPAQSVFMTLEGHARAQRKQQQEREHRITALQCVKLFAPLTDAERTLLASELSVAPFRRGEIVTREGNQAHYLYVITQGDAEVSISVEGERRHIAVLHAGEVFGEMGMMTGEPRLANVTAMTDLICYRLDKSAFEDIVKRRPEIAEAMSHLLVQRKLELDGIRQGLSAEAIKRHAPQAQSDLLHKIKQFFTLSDD